jgi:threonine dehydrogenase-like Zn-dependent dehydrogenase
VTERSHLTGGYAGGQAEYVRVPMADVAPMKVPNGMTDEEALFLTDIFPTGYQAAEQAGIQGGEIVAVWGTGPVGLFAIQSAKVLGAERIIAIETVPERITMARKAAAPTSSTSRKRMSMSGSKRSARAKAPMS